MRFSRLPVAEGAGQYQEIIARIPWVSDPDEGALRADGGEHKPPRGRKLSPITRRPAPFLLGTAVVAGSFAAIAVVGLVAGLVRGAPSPPASPGAAPMTQAPRRPVIQ